MSETLNWSLPPTPDRPRPARPAEQHGAGDPARFDPADPVRRGIDRSLAAIRDRTKKVRLVERKVSAWAQEWAAAVAGVTVETRGDPVRVVVVQARPDYDPELLRSLAALAVDIRNDPATDGVWIDPMCLPPCGPEDVAAFLAFESDGTL